MTNLLSQLNQKIQSQDWTRDINYRDQATGLCPDCGQETGGGKSCQGCGHGLAAAPAAQKSCGNCGTRRRRAKDESGVQAPLSRRPGAGGWRG